MGDTHIVCGSPRRQIMTSPITVAKASKAVRTRTKVTSLVSKSNSVTKLLARSRGATLADLAVATGWQPHSVRALLSGLRKKGILLVRDARKSGESCYRIVSVQADKLARPQRVSAMLTPEASTISTVSSTTAVEVA